MRAGLLTHRLTVCRYLNVQSESGEQTKVKREVCSIRAAMLRQQGNYSNNGEEMHDTVRLSFETWYRPEIHDSDIVLYNGQEFYITLIEHAEFSNTMKLHLTKINK